MTKRFPEASSARASVLLLLVAAVGWLVVSGIFEMLAAWKLVFPGLLSGEACLTYGRVDFAAKSAFVYGWGCGVGFGVGVWLIARLAEARIAASRWVFVAAVFWNVGVLAGIAGILAGDSSSVGMLEFPAYATPLLWMACLFLGVWALTGFAGSRDGPAYVSVRYVLAGFLGFAWLFSTANILLLWHPVQGSAQPAIDAWYCGGLLALWFLPVGLAWIYFAIPESLGRAVGDYSVALLGFWFLVAIGGWMGMSRLAGGPVPVWMASIGAAAGVMMLVPVAAVAVNCCLSLKGRYRSTWQSDIMKFPLFGAACFVIAGGEGVLLAIPTISDFTRFTNITAGNLQLALLGFFTMTMAGAIYRIVPELSGREWLRPSLIRWHFRIAAGSIIVLFLAPMLLGSIAFLGLLAAHGIFAAHLCLMLCASRNITYAAL